MTDVPSFLQPPQVQRWEEASKVKKFKDIDIPELSVWNYGPCEKHETPTPDCEFRACGGDPFKHQKITATFSYIAKRSLVSNSTGTGKQQPVTEPVLTPSGWKPIGELSPGDYVIGSNGKPTKVLEVHPQTERRVFKVTFSDGSWTLAGPEHLWLAGAKSMLHQGYPMKVVTTEHIKNTIHRQWSIPMTSPVEFDPISLPCDPYTVGVVLGDGSMSRYGGAAVSTDIEILEAIGANGIKQNKKVKYSGEGRIPVSVLNHALPFARSWEKSVPAEYMVGAPEDRLALLQGLLDTDGYPMHTGGVEFSTTSEQLADQVRELAESLGGVARKSSPRVTRYTHNGEKREGRPSWRVNVKLPEGVLPFRLQRKLSKWVPPTKYQAKRVIRSVEQVEDQDSVCISVEAEDNLYLTRHYIVTHNTGSALLSLALAHHYGEDIKALVVVQGAAVGQWVREIERWTPGFKVVGIPRKTSKKVRMDTYVGEWDILVTGYQSYLRDAPSIRKLPIKQIIIDDVDPIMNVNNKVFKALDAQCRKVDMVIVQNATSMATHLEQLYSTTVLIGARDVWGTLANFRDNYITRDYVTVFPRRKKGQKAVEARKVWKTTGTKNMNALRKRFRPMHIRFTYEDLEGDAQIPQLISEQVYFEMTKPQRDRYSELQDGVRTILNDKGMEASKKAATALTAFTIGSQICAGTFALKTIEGGYEEDHAEASPKLDWIMEKITNEWKSEKVVVYAKFVGAIKALRGRLSKEKIKYSTIWGQEKDPTVQEQEMKKFWEDPDTRVMIISVSGERSLNLQNASILVMWDLQLNPARVTQIAGRVKRLGSKNKRVYVFTLLMEDSQEERYMTRLSARQELFDFVFDTKRDPDEDSDSMIIERLDPEEVLRLIRP